LSRAGADLQILAGSPRFLPEAEHGFEFAIGEPVGANRLSALVLPLETLLPKVVETNRRTRGIAVLPKQSASAWADLSVNEARSSQIAFAELPYQISARSR
jgi:hypothetical protein